MILSKTAILILNQIIDDRMERRKKSNSFCDFSDFVENTSSNEYKLMPNIFLWDPIGTSKESLILNCPHCQGDGFRRRLRDTEEWERGKSKSMMPRTIKNK